MLIPAAALLALVPLTLIERLAHTAILYPRLLPVAVYALGVACLGLIDDTLGGPALARGAPSPGAGADMWRRRCAASRPPAR